MACNCDISIIYTLAATGTTGGTMIRVGPSVLTEDVVINDHSSYILTDAYYGVFTWQYQDSQWVIINEDDVVIAYLPNSSELDCPGNSGEYGGTEWVVVSVLVGGILSYMTTYACTPAPVCTSWDSVPTIFPDYLAPYNYYLLFLDIDLTSLYVGQPVSYFQHNSGLTVSGNGQYYIASILYIYNNQIFSTYTSGAQPLGIMLQDSEGTLIWPSPDNGGHICFQPENYTTTEETNKECFDKLVWEKQCEFSKQVLNYLNKMQYGDFTCCDDLDNLKNQRRALSILNCYDTRDIAYNTTDYNNLTYSQIKKLLNS
jgi:hypothetical protein